MLRFRLKILWRATIQYHLPAGIKKKPSRQDRKGCSFSSQPTRKAGPNGTMSAANVAADDVAEQFPLVSLELHQLKLGDRREIGGAGVNLDARKQTTKFQIPDARRLLHDVFSREIVAALLQHIDEPLRDGVGVHDRTIDPVALREVFDEKLVECLHARVILPLRIGGILEVV